MTMYPYNADSLPCECLIDEGLYIGDFKLALRVLSSDDHLGVTHMISLVSSSILSSMCSESSQKLRPPRKNQLTEPLFETAKRGSLLSRMTISLADTPEEDISQIMLPCFEFIDEGRKHGTVLVHCMAGRSRSAAIVIGYLMWSMGLSLEHAMGAVNRRYRRASPNSGYMKQLERLESELCRSQRAQNEIHDHRHGLVVAC
ncbi:hypothetical protein KP509_26G001900 [Ceratopteris richardii]|uniref:Uncharacterized protein n=1 Tax=Ceratopteris richardii TaxID=49495 RepID=A0A8T2RJU1_CERRI|nr:hypothetical protein KP509_26G001900 [Ceratopteris richardii]